MNYSRDTKQIFSIRKYKAYGASSVLLGALTILGAQGVSADETSQTPTAISKGLSEVTTSDIDDTPKTFDKAPAVEQPIITPEVVNTPAPLVSLNTTTLKDLLDRAYLVDTSSKTEASVRILHQAIKEAKEILDNPTTQDKIDQVQKQLEIALAHLVEDVAKVVSAQPAAEPSTEQNQPTEEAKEPAQATNLETPTLNVTAPPTLQPETSLLETAVDYTVHYVDQVTGETVYKVQKSAIIPAGAATITITEDGKELAIADQLSDYSDETGTSLLRTAILTRGSHPEIVYQVTRLNTEPAIAGQPEREVSLSYQVVYQEQGVEVYRETRTELIKTNQAVAKTDVSVSADLTKSELSGYSLVTSDTQTTHLVEGQETTILFEVKEQSKNRKKRDTPAKIVVLEQEEGAARFSYSEEIANDFQAGGDPDTEYIHLSYYKELGNLLESNQDLTIEDIKKYTILQFSKILGEEYTYGFRVKQYEFNNLRKEGEKWVYDASLIAETYPLTSSSIHEHPYEVSYSFKTFLPTADEIKRTGVVTKYEYVQDSYRQGRLVERPKYVDKDKLDYLNDDARFEIYFDDSIKSSNSLTITELNNALRSRLIEGKTAIVKELRIANIHREGDSLTADVAYTIFDEHFEKATRLLVNSRREYWGTVEAHIKRGISVPRIPDADLYNPTTVMIGALLNSDVDPSKLIQPMPVKTTYEWVKKIDTSELGTRTGILKVIYPDKTSDTVEVGVWVYDMAGENEPKQVVQTVNLGQAPTASNSIGNMSQLPPQTSASYKTPVDTQTAGDKEAIVVVTYPDRSKDEVPVTVKVVDNRTQPGTGTQPSTGTEPGTGTGTPADTVDTDKDGIPDIQDTDDDNDGVSDADELAAGLNPKNPDSDGDGTPDGQEDTDGDGLTNDVESDETKPGITDQDNDGISDVIAPADKPGAGTEPGVGTQPGAGTPADTVDTTDNGQLPLIPVSRVSSSIGRPNSLINQNNNARSSLPSTGSNNDLPFAILSLWVALAASTVSLSIIEKKKNN
ncbi:Rib/alpha-like domain-containing protein [Streptococcus pluranimalium]|uniref:Rib/alpha-like domain-containing protein n=1 Tax=Streptococcus pluranimalium TaxID=82348 RepID=UPI0039FC5090